MYVVAIGESSPRSGPIESDLILLQLRGRVFSSSPKHPLLYPEGLGLIPALL